MSIAFLGHIVSEDGITTDPSKVDKICNISAPKDKMGIRSILGLANYYKLLHHELLCNNIPSTGTVEEVSPL